MVDGKTGIYGLFGFPVTHSLSPAMHNVAFNQLNINAIYLPFAVAPEKLKEAVNSIKTFGIQGVNVTVPHKENIIKHLDNLSEDAYIIQAVNTVVNKDGKLMGHNTDGYGFINSLMEMKFNPKDKSFLIVGSGGAARAISINVAKHRAKEIFICDVIEEKAKKLKDYTKSVFSNCYIEAVSPEDLKVLKNRIDILVNATPIGLKKDDPLVVDKQLLKRDIFVYDLIYNPAQTKLLALAEKMGLACSNGLNMLLYQGALSFKLWTGKNPPVAVMKKALLDAIP